jgi:hypothetical protein
MDAGASRRGSPPWHGQHRQLDDEEEGGVIARTPSPPWPARKASKTRGPPPRHPPPPPQLAKESVRRSSRFQASHRPLGALSKGLATSRPPAWIHHRSEQRPIGTDPLVPCRSTRRPATPASSRSSLGRLALPILPHHQGRLGAREAEPPQAQSREAGLITNIPDLETRHANSDHQSTPSLGSTPGCAEPDPPAPTPYSKTTVQRPQTLELHLKAILAPPLRHLRPPWPPEGLGIGSTS